MSAIPVDQRDGFEAGHSVLVQRAAAGILRGDSYFKEVLDVLPAAVYITDPEGMLTYYNEAAAVLWGHRPALGEAQWCGSWKLYTEDGRPLPHDQCPMAVALKQLGPAQGIEAVAERPDGRRVPFIPYPTLLHDAAGTLVGAVNILVDITDRKRAEEVSQWFAAIVASSDDAIISKDLDGTIRTWNDAAQRLFGYTADEAIGRHVTILIPPDRVHEEPGILARIHRGEKVDHYETIRRRKDGSLVDISLTISPVRDAGGRIVGASKIAREITERRRADEQQNLLLREMDHRVKNAFTIAGTIVTLSARKASTPAELTENVSRRLQALARGHSLTLPGVDGNVEHSTTLHTLIRTILAPYDGADESEARAAITGSDVSIGGRAITSFALLLHEFATNAAKYGALSTPEGKIEIECSETGKDLILLWKERGGPPVERSDLEGFGSLLARVTVKGQFGGDISRDWQPEGLSIRLRVARDRIAD